MSLATSTYYKKAQASHHWRLFFGLWLALIIPFMAFGVSYSKATAPVRRVSGEHITNTNLSNENFNVPARDAFTLEHQAMLHPDQITRAHATATLNRLRETWASKIGIPVLEWDAVATSARTPEKIIIAVKRDLYSSSDYGQTFEIKPKVLPSMVNSLAMHPTNLNVLYAGIEGLGFFTSQDNGDTWQPANTGIQVTPGARFGITAIVIDEQVPQTMYIAAGVWLGTSHVTYHPLGILKTTNGGATWMPLENQVAQPIQALMLDTDALYAWSNGQRVQHQLD